MSFLSRYWLYFFGCALFVKVVPAHAQYTTASAQDGEYSYQYVTNDPLNVRIYTLRNGMKVYMSPNHKTPRIEVAVAVRVGSKDDPRDNTGLAHYLEHMLFKGSSQFGTVDWAS